MNYLITFFTNVGLLFILLITGGCDINKPMTLSGIVEVREVRLGFEEPGVIEHLYVDVNDAVKQGQEMATLNNNQLQLEYDALNYELKRAESELENLIHTPRPEELAAARARLSAATTAFELAKYEFQSSKKLYEKKVQSQQKYTQYESQYKRLAAELEAIRSETALIESGSKSEIIDAQRMQIESLQKKVAVLDTRLRQRHLTAPINGTVLTRNFEEGEYIQAGQYILSVADLDDCWIKIYLPESALADVSIGTEVDVHFDSKVYPALKGHVSEISQEAAFAPRMNLRKEQRSDLYFPLKIAVKNTKHMLKPGMAADVLFRN